MEYHKGGRPADGEPILPDFGEMAIPKIEMGEVLGIFLGTIDAAKERTRKEVLREVFDTLDKLRGKDGCVAVDVLKRVLGEKR
jgi:Ca2+-binding EF-hand superfamily protein